MWLYFALAAATIWAAVNVLDKILLSRYVTDPRVFSVVGFFPGVIAAIAAMLLTGRSFLLTTQHLVALFVGVLSAVSILLYFNAMKHEEVSRIIPLFFVVPVFVLLFATLFLGERFTFYKYIGIFLVTAGAVLVSVRSKAGIVTKIKALEFIIPAIILWAGIDVIAKWAISSLDFFVYVTYVSIGAFLTTLLYLFSKEVRTGVFKLLGQTKLVAIVVSDALVAFCASILFYYAVSQAPISLVAASNASQALFVTVFATIATLFVPRFIEEELNARTIAAKLLSSSLIILGVYLIS